jgi:hypothetical protein
MAGWEMEDTVEDTEDMRTGVFPINGSAQLVSVGGPAFACSPCLAVPYRRFDIRSHQDLG